MIKLTEIDLSKRFLVDGRENYHLHPDVEVGKDYLAKIGGSYHAGRFSQQWFGLTFYEWHGQSLQYDRPGVNSSSWEGLWEIED